MNRGPTLARTGAALTALSLLLAPAHAQDCEMSHGIWASEEEEGLWIVYTSDRFVSFGWNTFFELWRDDRRLARLRGNITCSNGISICVLRVEDPAPVDHRHPGDEGPFLSGNIPYVTINTEAREDMPEWLVFAHLPETIAFVQRATGKVGRTLHLDPSGIADAPYLVPPAAYRFFGCRTEAFDAEPYGSADLYLDPAEPAR